MLGADLPLFAPPTEGSPSVLPASPAMPSHLSVSELTAQIRATLEPRFQQVWVQGEVSNHRPAASGHAYFSLKDSAASLSVACFNWSNRKRAFELRDGLQVLCRGKLSVYPPRGSYQLSVDSIEPVGAGALQLAFVQLREKLQNEGLLNPELKRALPAYPRQIAIVTSASGAVIQDMLTILRRRAPQIRVIIVPSLVQGEDAPNQLLNALQAAQVLGEIVVLARGGGSAEDLWAFNHEGLARAIRASRVPVISAVGHEIDFTISDLVADLRAPTPSAAAEIISGPIVAATQQFAQLVPRLWTAVQRDLAAASALLQQLAARVINPRDRLREQAQRCDDLALRLERAVRVQFEQKRGLIAQSMETLQALSPQRVLERGYALVREVGSARLIRSAAQMVVDQAYDVRFFDGVRVVQVRPGEIRGE